MTTCGIDSVTFGVEDMALARRFLDDWGLEDGGSSDECLRFLTRDRGEVLVRRVDDPTLPPAMEAGSTLRDVTWGVADDAGLAALQTRLGANAVTDPNGLQHSFRVTRRVKVQADPQEVNNPGVVRRIDTRSPVYERATPISLGHVVTFADDLDATVAFYVDRLGFTISDSYPGNGVFLRAQTPGPHHTAFVLRRPGKPGLNHLAFTVSNIHEVFGGGLAMGRKGWDTEIGPGRHPISSAYFWYFKSPFGGSLEYYTDDDWCTEAWQPREFERKPELFAEWAIAGGIDGNTRREKGAA